MNTHLQLGLHGHSILRFRSSETKPLLIAGVDRRNRQSDRGRPLQVSSSIALYDRASISA
jgi:hypothetical protein